MAGDDLGQAADGIFQLAVACAVLRSASTRTKGQHAQADGPSVDLGPVALDDAQLLQPLDAAPGGRGQADPAGQLGVGQPGVDSSPRMATS